MASAFRASWASPGSTPCCRAWRRSRPGGTIIRRRDHSAAQWRCSWGASPILPIARLGYGVHIPPRQTCCGALHLHQGDRDIARHLAECNTAAFNGLQLDAIINTASACGVTLAEYPRNDFPPLQAPIRDINSFLTELAWPAELVPAPLAKKVAIHDPCSLSNVLHQAKAPYHLLARIPQLEIVALPDNLICCGAAGSYMLSQPDIADSLRDDKIAALRTLEVDMVVTSNPGCALHLRTGIKAAELNLTLMHPIELLAKQLDAARGA